MSLELLLGASGHGKTTILYETLVSEAMENLQKRYVLIVPEQGSLQAQKDIVHLHKNHGVFNIDVLTFGRLGYRIFEELGVELPETIDETGKNLLIRKVMDEVNSSLRLIHPSKRPGFISDVKSMLSELKQYGITPDMLQSQVDGMQTNHRLREKLQDLHTIYEAYQSAMEGQFITAEDKPELLLSVIERSSFLQDATVAIDGFTGFTPVQYRLLSHMLAVCEAVRVTVTLPEDVEANVISGEEELFYMSKQMIYKCGHLADELQVPVQVKRLRTDKEQYRFALAPELDFLEQNLFRYNGKKYTGECQAIAVYGFQTESEEVRYIAADLARRVREDGLRYREAAIIAGDLEQYSQELIRVLDEAGIPYFLDEKRSILGNPLVELVRGAIAVVQQNATYESMFHLLKNLLCPIAQEDVDILENYVLAFGVRGWTRYAQENFVRPYEKPSEKEEEDSFGRARVYQLERVNAIRKEVVTFLGDFWEAMTCKEQTVAGYITAIYAFLETAGAYEKMEALATRLEEQGQAKSGARAEEYRKVYGQVIRLMDRIHALMGEEKLSVKEFSNILDAGFDEIKVGIIPPSVDCTTIGDLKRTRLEHVKVLYVLGMNEGLIPKTESNRGILSEQEREFLAGTELELAPTTRQKIYEQNFYLYLNLTEPEQALIMTYHEMNEAGEKARQSRLIHQLKAMYGEEIVKEGSRDPQLLLVGPGNAMHLATEASQETSASYDALLSYLWQQPEYRSRMEEMLSVYQNDASEDSLSRRAAKELYEALRSGSVSRIETYASCAFAHFASYGLELEERKEYQLNSADMGTIFHRVLEILGRRLKDEGRSFRDLTEEERPALVQTCFEQATIDYGNSIFADSYENSFMKERMVHLLERTVWALGEQLAAGDFTPRLFEKSFTFDTDGVSIYGKIDRVDLYETEDTIQVKIIDYKSGSHELKYEDVYAGLQLQLLVYLKDVLQQLEKTHPLKKIVAAGAFYNQIDDPYVELTEAADADATRIALLDALMPTGVLNALSAENLDHALEEPSTKSHVIKAKTDASGLVKIARLNQSEDHLRLLADYATEKMVQMNREILEGQIQVNPYKDSCQYCPYGAICGVTRPGHEVKPRNKLHVKEEELWQLLDPNQGKEES